jgi:hypothetical protein
MEWCFITAVSDNGETRTVELTAATSVRLLDTSLHNAVSRYLQLIDDSRSQGQPDETTRLHIGATHTAATRPVPSHALTTTNFS